MIRFRKLVVKNFMSFGERQEISLYKQGVIRIEGRNLDEEGNDSNGSGKSAIIEALVWCLFGKTIRGLAYDKVVNRFAKKNCSVALQFSAGDASYTVRRYRKHRKHSNKVLLWVGDRLVSFRHEDDTQQRIVNILGKDFNAFCNSVIFGGVRPFASLPDSEQKKVLEGFLHFEQFDQALGRTKSLISEKEEAQQALRLTIERLSGKALAYREKLHALKKSEGIFVEELYGRYRDAKKKARHLRRDIWGTATLSKAIDKAEKKHSHAQAKSAKYQAKVNMYEGQLKRIRKAIDDRASLVGKSCPTCGSRISTDTIAAYLKHLLTEKSSIKSGLRASRERLDYLEREVKHGVRGLKDLQNKLEVLSGRNTRMAEAEEEVKRCKKKLAATRSSASPLDAEISETSILYSKALSCQLVSEQEKKSIEQAIEDLRFWEEGFGNRGIKALVIKEALPALNGKLSEYAEEIFGGKAELKFLPTKTSKKGAERELFHVHYAARKGADSYTAESSGRRKRVDICVLLCFSWLARTADLLCVDELLDGLDESGRENILRILASQRGTTFVISHRRDTVSHIGKVWTVIKKDGYSTVKAA